MNIKKTEWWRICNDLLFFSPEWVETTVPWLIMLSWVKWDEMTYGKVQSSCISFPWEYDVSDVSITCYEVEDSLHYVIQFADGERYSLLQHAAVLEKKDIEWIDTWYVTDSWIQQEIEQLELEWDIIILDQESSGESE